MLNVLCLFDRITELTESEEEIFRKLINNLSKKYPGNKYLRVRYLLHDHLTISQLTENKSVIHLFNELEMEGCISYTNVKVLSDIAELTKNQSAIRCVNEYKQDYNANEGIGLNQYRKQLFKALRQVSDYDLTHVVCSYELNHFTFENIWHAVFYLETEKHIEFTRVKMERFGNLLNATAKGILLGMYVQESC